MGPICDPQIGQCCRNAMGGWANAELRRGAGSSCETFRGIAAFVSPNSLPDKPLIEVGQCLDTAICVSKSSQMSSQLDI